MHGSESSAEDDEEAPPASEELFFDDENSNLYERYHTNSDGSKPLTSQQKHLLSFLGNCRIESFDNQATVC